MTIYIILFILFIIVGATNDLIPSKHKKTLNFLFSCIACSALFVICAFKGLNVGTDTAAYIKMYELFGGQSVLHSVKTGHEVLFVVCGKLFYSAGIPYIGFQIFCYILMIGPFFYLMGIRSQNFTLSIVYFCGLLLVFYLSGIRQSIALSFFALAYDLSFNSRMKRWLKWASVIGLTLIAALFHKTAIIGLVLFATRAFQFKKEYIFFLVPLLLLSFFSSGSIYQILYYTYNKTSYMPGTYGGGGMFFVYCALFILYALFSNNSALRSFLTNKTAKWDEGGLRFLGKFFVFQNNELPNKLIISSGNWSLFFMAFFQSFCRVNLQFPRFGFYFIIAGILFWPEMLSTLKGRTFRSIVCTLFVLALTAFFFISYAIPGALNITPYSFYF